MNVMIDKKMIGAVIAEFEQDNPELSFHEISSSEFADRMMKKIEAKSPEVTKEQTTDYATALWLIRERAGDPIKLARDVLKRWPAVEVPKRSKPRSPQDTGQ